MDQPTVDERLRAMMQEMVKELRDEFGLEVKKQALRLNRVEARMDGLEQLVERVTASESRVRTLNNDLHVIERILTDAL